MLSLPVLNHTGDTDLYNPVLSEKLLVLSLRAETQVAVLTGEGECVATCQCLTSAAQCCWLFQVTVTWKSHVK